MTFLLLALACSGPDPTPGANVLLVTLDTVRADALGSYGGTTPTPNLDRLAREGARFDHAWTVTPLTIPAHASIHTGLLPPRHGVRDNGDLFLAPEATTLAERLRDAGYRTLAAVGAEPASRHWGFDQGFEVYFDEMGPGGTGSRRWTVERRADAVVRDALAWLRPRLAEPNPWFGWVHLYDPHDPYRPPEPYATTYADDPYAGEVAFVDAQVGVLLDTLEQAGALAHTWIVVVSDHGESLGEHGEATHGVLLYAGATRVPLLVRPPTGSGWPTGLTIDAPVSLVDVLPTVLAATGLPDEPGIDGVSLLPLLRGEPPAAADRAVYLESLYAWRHFGWAPQRGLVTADRALLDSTTPELYARADHAQATDLAPTEPDTLAALRARLGAMEAGFGPPLPASRADTDPERAAMLEALGYFAGVSEQGRDADGAPLTGLPDPVSRLPVLAATEEARAAYRRGDMEAARRTAEAAVAADPGMVETRLLLATILWRTGDPKAALALATAVDAERPGSQTRHLMGLLELQTGHPEEAARLLGDAVLRDPTNAAASETWLQTLLVLEDLPALAAGAAEAHTHLPNSAIVEGLLGVSHALAGRAAEARPLLEDAIRRAPAQPFVHHGLGLALRDLGDTEGAAVALQEEIRRFPPARPSRAVLEAMGR